MEIKKTWHAPTMVELPAGMEIGAYAPSELDRDRLVKRPPPRG